MTNYAITHTCQHADDYDLRGEPAKREWEAGFLASIACRACRAATAASYPGPNSLPVLVGAPNELPLAERYRVPKIRTLKQELDEQIEMASIHTRAYKVAKSRGQSANIIKWAVLWISVARITDAKWWIDTRTLDHIALARRAMRDGFVPEGTMDD